MNLTNRLTHKLATTKRCFSLARFLLDAPVLPLLADTLPVAEQVRRSLLSICKYLARRENPGLADADVWPLSPAFWGKDEEGDPRTGHEHAFFLPADEDGDGRLDHITVHAPMGFNDLERRALDRLRQINPMASRAASAAGLIPGASAPGVSPGVSSPRISSSGADPLALLLIGLGSTRDFRAPLLEESAVWISATPFIVTRYPKLRGTKRDRPEDYATPTHFARRVLCQELDRLRARRPALPECQVEPLSEGIGAHKLRPIQFKRFRAKRGDDGGRRPAGGFRITFAAPVAGPICLGHSCHFGMGLFVPVRT